MKLLVDFKKAAKEIADDLAIEKEQIKIEHFETPKIGLDYTARLLEGERGFDFHLRTNTEEQDPTSGEMTASLTIFFEEDMPCYYFSENIDYVKGHPNFLSRWVSWAVFNFRQTHHRVNLESLFRDTDVLVWGMPGYSSDEEADLLFHGILAIQETKVLICRFRHVSTQYLCRSFSYAVLVKPKMGRYLWVVFPDSCGLDSGGGCHDYLHFENLIQMISEKIDVEVRRFDICYDDLKLFLQMNAYDFYRTVDTKRMLYDFYRPVEVLEGSESQYDNFMERLKKNEYAQALRDLRALVQQAQENVLRMKEIDYSDISKPNITKLSHRIIDAELIDGRLKTWFEAFASIANISSHKDFPTRKDMDNSILRTRVLLTFYLGLQLLHEMDNIVKPALKFVEPEIEIDYQS